MEVLVEIRGWNLLLPPGGPIVMALSFGQAKAINALYLIYNAESQRCKTSVF